jgi:propionyl-CoA synthetase
MISRFDEVYRRSLEQRQEFWAEAAAAIDWVEPWKQVLDDSQRPMYRWFSGARINTCYNALDRHVERGPGRSGRTHPRLSRDRDNKIVYLSRATR